MLGLNKFSWTKMHSMKINENLQEIQGNETIESPETHNSNKECIYDKDHILNQQGKNYYLT